MKKSNTNTVLYLYGISASKTKPHTEPGIDGTATIEALQCAGMICWVSWVPKTDFADQLAANMENLDWLAETSTRHQAAVGAIAEVNDVLPARLGTVFLGEDSLKANVQNRKKTLQAELKRIQGSQEWGIKVFAQAPEAAPISRLKGGKSYLQAKSALLKSRQSAGPDEETARFSAELQGLSEATAEGGKISGGQRNLQYQVSLLVKRAHRKKLETLLQRFSKNWQATKKIECTGPWPPYSFVSRLTE